MDILLLSAESSWKKNVRNLRLSFVIGCFWLIYATPCKASLDCTIGPCRLYGEQSIRFFVIGDWGGKTSFPYYTVAQKACSDLLMDASFDKKPQFFIGTGDNFYSYGVDSVDDPRFQTSFDDMYLYGKNESIPWYMTAGNHDYYGNVTAQILYSEINDRWVYPDLAYRVMYDTDDNGPSVDFIMIDTVVLCGTTWYGGFNPRTGRREGRRKEPRGPEDVEQAEEMWAWLEKQLNESVADYLFVVGHYPAFNSNKKPINPCLVPRLQNLLDVHHATGYITGHKHNLQHLTTKGFHGRVIHHTVSGAGHLVEDNYRSLNIIDDQYEVKCMYFFPRRGLDTQKQENDRIGGFVYGDLRKDAGKFEFYHCNGDFLYEYKVEPRNRITAM